jgi:murein DD-endopeptidase MepM/ murein hydrolase activator NlpD
MSRISMARWVNVVVMLSLCLTFAPILSAANTVSNQSGVQGNTATQAQITYPGFKWPWDSTYNGKIRWTGGPHSWSTGGQLTVTISASRGSGLDFAMSGASFPVVAMASGTVIKNKCGFIGLGCIVAIKHDVGGSVMIYAHLQPNAAGTAPRNGIQEQVWYPQGTTIGYAGQSGGQVNIHLHIDFRDGSSTCTAGNDCGDIGFAGNPIGWDGQKLVDGYYVSGYFDSANQCGPGADCDTIFNYDGSAVKGAIAAPYLNFPYSDNGIQRYVMAFVHPSFTCSSTTNCEIDAPDGTTVFAGQGRFSGGGGILYSTNSTGTPPPPPTVDNATFVSDITIPDPEHGGPPVSPGQALHKVWRVRNSGTSTWGSGYQLVFVGGDQMSAPASVSVSTTVPGATADLAVDMTAPSTGGTYEGHWRLRNAQGVYFGDELWIKITVPGGTPPAGDEIDLTCVDCPVTVMPGQQFRPVIRARVNSGQLLERRGDMLRNTDGNLYGAWPHVAVVGTVNAGQTYDFVFYANNPITAPGSDGTYESKWHVWRNGNWAGPEITIRFQVGSSGGSNYPPNAPTLTGPGDWAIFQGNPVVLTAQHNGDPDGDAITGYYFDLMGPNPRNSGWIGSNTWNPTGLPYSNYEWRVKVRDSRGAESGWSAQTWHFNVLNNEPEIYEFYSTTCRDAWGGPEKICFCAKTNAGTLQLQVNTATDGSDQGEWRIINEIGLPEYRCQEDSDHPPNTNNLEWETGTHRARLYARREGGWENAAYRDITFSLPAQRRPNNPAMLLPTYNAYVNSKTVRFDWRDTLRTTDYHLEVSTDPNYGTKLVDQHLGVSTSEYTHTFDSDYETLYWRVKATGPYGTNGGEGSGSRFHIDLDAPGSAVTALPTVTIDTAFPVRWGGSDARSGLRWYDVQFRDGPRGEWVTWMAQTTATSALFRGEPGHTYYFHCWAMDNVGNWEEYYPSGNGDTYTLVDPTAAPPMAWWNSAYSFKRNLVILNSDSNGVGSHYPVHLHFDSTTTPTAEEIYNASQTAIKGNDVRLVYQDQTELDRFVQEFSATNVDIWFALQGGLGGGQSDSTNHQLYYGNATAETPP